MERESEKSRKIPCSRPEEAAMLGAIFQGAPSFSHSWNNANYITWNDVGFSFGATESELPERHACHLSQRDPGWRESFESHMVDETVWREDRRKGC